MTTWTTGRARRAGSGAAVLCAVLLGAGCATDDAVVVGAGPSTAASSSGPTGALSQSAAPSPSGAPATPDTLAESWSSDPAAETLVARAEQPDRLLVTTLGSSTCPELPVDATWDARRTSLRIAAAHDQGVDRPCTMDLVPTTSVVPIEGLPDYEFTATVNGEAITVPPVG
ncbi:hypothetical protein [Cellulomonas chengniuliangii]|uniref:Lipoprotein n=1 Tax=Cellulomonas chengniuliangii TaxID=2968084 RepID=A0ABY5KYZ6_9CELL|nr:hypothetical protein [Cellulomonas chengniuliangii]MCC2307489.1 hypothetical protein [Cellulomonas chengniuliangii]UUI75737.1 hypothetical protein NP064_02115 [Cellulomonas chengniuliangii]